MFGEFIREVSMMSGHKVYENEFLLNLAGHRTVAWVLIKLSRVYGYVGLFV
jgi:hypothetical protein